MKIYLDLVFIINFFFDFLLLYGTSKILKRLISLKRLLLGSIVGAFSIVFLLFPLNSLELLILKVFLSTVIILITFGRKNFFQNMLYFYLLSIILGGTLYLFDITISYKNTGILFITNGYSLNFILVITTTPIIIYLYVKEHLNYKTKIAHKFQVEIKLNSISYQLEAILDTGNNLTDPYKKRSIILIDKKVDIQKKRVIYVPYKALNTTGVIPCILPDKVIINQKEYKNLLIGLSTDKFSLNGISCILPNKLKEDLCLE